MRVRHSLVLPLRLLPSALVLLPLPLRGFGGRLALPGCRLRSLALLPGGRRLWPSVQEAAPEPCAGPRLLLLLGLLLARLLRQRRLLLLLPLLLWVLLPWLLLGRRLPSRLLRRNVRLVLWWRRMPGRLAMLPLLFWRRLLLLPGPLLLPGLLRRLLRRRLLLLPGRWLLLLSGRLLLRRRLPLRWQPCLCSGSRLLRLQDGLGPGQLANRSRRL